MYTVYLIYLSFSYVYPLTASNYRCTRGRANALSLGRVQLHILLSVWHEAAAAKGSCRKHRHRQTKSAPKFSRVLKTGWFIKVHSSWRVSGSSIICPAGSSILIKHFCRSKSDRLTVGGLLFWASPLEGINICPLVVCNILTSFWHSRPSTFFLLSCGADNQTLNKPNWMCKQTIDNKQQQQITAKAVSSSYSFLLGLFEWLFNSPPVSPSHCWIPSTVFFSFSGIFFL